MLNEGVQKKKKTSFCCCESDVFRFQGQVLQEEIEHHVEEEEMRMEGLFAQARKAELDLDALGEQLAARKQEADRDLQG